MRKSHVVPPPPFNCDPHTTPAPAARSRRRSAAWTPSSAPGPPAGAAPTGLGTAGCGSRVAWQPWLLLCDDPEAALWGAMSMAGSLSNALCSAATGPPPRPPPARAASCSCWCRRSRSCRRPRRSHRCGRRAARGPRVALGPGAVGAQPLSRSAAPAAVAGSTPDPRAHATTSPPPAPARPQGGAPLVELLKARLAHRAMGLLQDDEDDLFYETGRYHSALMAGLVGGGVQFPPASRRQQSQSGGLACSGDALPPPFTQIPSYTALACRPPRPPRPPARSPRPSWRPCCGRCRRRRARRASKRCALCSGTRLELLPATAGQGRTAAARGRSCSAPC
jgi:hypothetical protein